MAGVVNTARLSARVARRHAISRYTPSRAFRASARQREAQNYTMPALSPTMSEGNIASWKIKEGDSFSVGDVILEIETDKATMDVEAQDDGVLFKIMHGDGAKGVRVGERIAVFAEQGDDLQSLEIPAEDTSKIMAKSEGNEESASKEEQTSSQSEEKKEESSEKQAEPSTSGSPSKDESTLSTGSKPQKQTYPLFPAVQLLLHQNGYANDEAAKISGSGPNGRILKGDVLAYLGRINKDYPVEESKRLEQQAHLDLSNITPAKPKPEEAAKQEQKPSEPEAPTETEIAVPISLSAVIATQKRVQDSLGIFLPLSTFIARASELANEDLPARKSRKPSADDLFNSVLGLDQVAQKSSRGHFIPQIIGISPPPVVAPAVMVKKPDIIDILAPKAAKVKVPAVPLAPVGVSADGNIFSVTAKNGDEARAAEYLERMKVALEKEPGRLVL